MGKNGLCSQLNIDPEFRDLLPEPTEEEMAILEGKLLEEGCREPILAWANHDDTIIDHHHVYGLCRKHDIPFKVQALVFETREEVVEWIIAHHRGRRNMTPEQVAKYRTQKFKKHSETPPAEGIDGHGVQNCLLGGEAAQNPKKTKVGHPSDGSRSVLKKLAHEEGISEKTAERSVKHGQAIEAIGAVSPDAEKLILSGRSKLSRDRVIEIGNMAPKDRRKACAELLSPTPKSEPTEKPAMTVEERMQEANKVLDAYARKITDLAKEVDQIDNAHLSDGDHARIETFKAQMRSAASTVRSAKGAGVCTYCGGSGCKPCRKTGWLTRSQLDSAPVKCEGAA